MRNRRFLLPLALVFAAQMAGTGCLLFPQLEDRIVELALGGSTTGTFEAVGELGVHDKYETVDLADSVDVGGILDDAGVDVSDVKSIRIAGAWWRVTRADPDPSREIQNGNVTVSIDGGPEVSLLSNFTAPAGAVTGWNVAALDAAGVTELNGLLDQILADLGAGVDPEGNVTIHVSGVSSPTGVETDFQYQIKLDVSIVGTVKLQVVD